MYALLTCYATGFTCTTVYILIILQQIQEEEIVFRLRKTDTFTVNIYRNIFIKITIFISLQSKYNIFNTFLENTLLNKYLHTFICNWCLALQDH